MMQSFPELTLGGVLVAPFVLYAGLALVIFLVLRPFLFLVGFDRLFVNGGLNPGQRSGVKPGQWIGHADMERAPIGALSMSARIFDQAAVISPVSGSMLSAVAWFCSALTDARRRPTDCLRR